MSGLNHPSYSGSIACFSAGAAARPEHPGATSNAVPPITVTTPAPKARHSSGARVEAGGSTTGAQAQPAPTRTAQRPVTKSATKTAPSAGETAAPAAADTQSAGHRPTARGKACGRPPAKRSARVSRVVTARRHRSASRSATLPDALRSLPGVSVTGPAAPAASRTCACAARKASHTLVMIDGIQANTPPRRVRFFQPARRRHRADRSDPRAESGLYGTGAVGGVINITTKRPRARDADGARRNRFVRHTRYVQRARQAATRPAISRHPANGERSTASTSPEAVNSTTGETDRVRLGSFALNGGVKLAPNASLDVTLRNIDKFADRDAFDSFVGVPTDDDLDAAKSRVWLAGVGTQGRRPRWQADP